MTRRGAGAALVAAALAAALVAGAWRVSRPASVEEVRATLSAVEALAADDTAGYARADGPRDFRFPDDHAPHPGFRNEWWYVTGNLRTPGGRRLGYQLVLFRSALAPEAPDGGGSAWSTNQAWMAHLALADPDGVGFRAAERFARGALNLAGSEAEPLRVRVEDWSIEADESGSFPGILRATEGDVGLDLGLEPLKPPVLHGEGGFHVKDPASGSASYYYSLTRLRTHGTVRAGGETLAVEGLSWMDREWSTGGLPPGVEGWDWMGLQLDDGRELMVYRLRGAGGGGEGWSGGTLVARDGSVRRLAPPDVHLEVLERWRSPRDAAEYPSAWRVAVPAAGLDLEVRPVLEDQELDLAYRYWEGAVDVRERGRAETAGWGYLEMTGYRGEAARGSGGGGRR